MASVRIFLLLVAIFFPLMALLGLGTWQVYRMDWKAQLIEQVETRRQAPPVELAQLGDWPTIDAIEEQYTPILMTGTYRHDLERHLYFPLTQPQGPLGGQGNMVFTPLEVEADTYVLVNRGFVPDDLKDPATRRDAQYDGEVTVTGLLRQSEPTSYFSSPPDEERNVWFTRDVSLLTADLHAGGGTIAPFYVDASASMTPASGVPQAGETRIVFSNNHLHYAITWYGLALALIGVTIGLVRYELKKGREDEERRMSE